jgi:hypothetical protein
MRRPTSTNHRPQRHGGVAGRPSLGGGGGGRRPSRGVCPLGGGGAAPSRPSSGRCTGEPWPPLPSPSLPSLSPTRPGMSIAAAGAFACGRIRVAEPEPPAPTAPAARSARVGATANDAAKASAPIDAGLASARTTLSDGGLSAAAAPATPAPARCGDKPRTPAAAGTLPGPALIASPNGTGSTALPDAVAKLTGRPTRAANVPPAMRLSDLSLPLPRLASRSSPGTNAACSPATAPMSLRDMLAPRKPASASM